MLRLLINLIGFTRDIGVTPDDLNLAISLFFITFVLFQPLSAAIGRWLGAKHWITIMMVTQPLGLDACNA
jgi:MFS family permease